MVEINNQSKDPKRPSLPSWFSVSARDALAAVFVAAESAAEESNSSAPIFDQLAANVANLNRELAANKVRFAVDLVLLPTEKWVSVLLFTFTLDRLVHYVASDGTVAEISWVKRFDSVAYRYRLLGFTGPGRQPVVLLGPIEDWLVSDLLVAAGSTTAGSRNISEGVSAALAEAVVEIAGDDGKRLALLVARRQAVFAAVNRRLQSRGATLRAPSGIVIDWNWRRELVSVATAEQLKELEAVQGELEGASMGAALDKLQVAVARATEGHELQHQLDGAGSLQERAVAEVVAAQTGRTLSSEQRTWMAGEVSALLAEVARADRATALSLARQVMIAAGRVSLEQIAARAVLQLLSHDSVSQLKRGPRVDAVALLATPVATIRQRAKSHWATLFGGLVGRGVGRGGARGDGKTLDSPIRKPLWSALRETH